MSSFLLELLWFLAFFGYMITLLHPTLNIYFHYGKVRKLVQTTTTITTNVSFSLTSKQFWTSLYTINALIVVIYLIYFAQFQKLLLLVYLSHLIRRSYECFFIHKFSNQFPIQLIVAATGFGFYFATLSSLIFISRFEQLEIQFHPKYIPFFIILQWKQFECHRILSLLRKDENYQTFSIPQTGLFQYVLSPHYLCEILLYLILYFMFPHRLLLYCFAFVLLNLVISAKRSKKWYETTFSSQRHQIAARYALIPFLF